MRLASGWGIEREDARHCNSRLRATAVERQLVLGQRVQRGRVESMLNAKQLLLAHYGRKVNGGIEKAEEVNLKW